MHDYMIAREREGPTRMNDDEFDVPMLALKDFDEMLAPSALVCRSHR